MAPETRVDVDLNKPFIAWSIGGSFTPKKLAAAQVVDVCNKMDVPVYLLGGSQEVEEAEAIIEACGQPNIKSFCGKLSLDQTALLIKNSRVLLSNDTGLMHIGAAFKKSIVSFWGCTKPSLGFAPYAAASDSIEILSTISKRPCSKHGKSCKHKSLGCIKFIDSKDIEKAVLKLL
jgi:heptosyltransferase-2